MINKNNGDVHGIKRINESLESHFQDLIQKPTPFIAMASYNFWLPDSIWKKIVANQCIKVAVIPYKFYADNKYIILNNENIIRSLITNGILVIINNNNHSKFLVTQNHTYFGSANLTGRAMNYNIEEIVSYDEGKKQSLIKGDIIKFILEQLYNYNSILKKSYNGKSIEKLHIEFTSSMDDIFDGFLTEEIESKVERETLSEYINKLQYVYAKIMHIISQHHMMLSLDEFYNLGRRAKKLVQIINKLLEMLRYEYNKKNYSFVYLSKAVREKLIGMKKEIIIFKNFYSGLLDSIVLPRNLDVFSQLNDEMVNGAIEVIEKCNKSE